MTLSRDRTGLDPSKLPDWREDPGSIPPGAKQLYVTESAQGSASATKGIAPQIGEPDSVLAQAPAVFDARDALSGAEGLNRQTEIYLAVRQYPRVGRTTIYVSSEATNGFAVGNDSNSGLSKALPKLTLSGAHATAANGDTIIINNSTTPYDCGAFNTINKGVTILPWTAWGVTLRGSSAIATLLIEANNVTLGKLIVDTNSVAGQTPVRSNVLPCSNLRLNGTRLLAYNALAFKHISSMETMGAFQTVSMGASQSAIQCLSGVAGIVKFGPGAVIDGPMAFSPTVSGVDIVLSGINVRGKVAVAGTALNAVIVTGANSLLIEDSEIGVDVSTTPTGIVVRGHATLPCASVTLRRNRIRHGVAAAQTVAGYGIGVGDELSVVGSLGTVVIHDNEINHANHGLFVGYGAAGGYSRGNVVRDAVIGVIAKGNTCGYEHRSNIVIGGPLSGGGLRSKLSTGALFLNNLVVFDASSVAAGTFEQADTASIATEFTNNCLYAPGLAVSKATTVSADSTATFRNNNYHSGSYAAGAFGYGAATYDTVAAWTAAVEPSALAVDPLFNNAPGGDYRLTAGSALANAGAVGGAPLDLIGNAFTSRVVGPLPVAA